MTEDLVKLLTPREEIFVKHSVKLNTTQSRIAYFMPNSKTVKLLDLESWQSTKYVLSEIQENFT